MLSVFGSPWIMSAHGRAPVQRWLQVDYGVPSLATRDGLLNPYPFGVATVVVASFLSTSVQEDLGRINPCLSG